MLGGYQRERENEKVEKRRWRESEKGKEEKVSGSQHTSTLLQVMFILEHLKQMWVNLLRYTAYNIAVMVWDEGMGLVHGIWRMFVAWSYARWAMGLLRYKRSN